MLKLKERYQKPQNLKLVLPTGRLANVIIGLEYKGHISISIDGLKECPTIQEVDYIKKIIYKDFEVYQVYAKNFDNDKIIHLWGNIFDDMPDILDDLDDIANKSRNGLEDNHIEDLDNISKMCNSLATVIKNKDDYIKYLEEQLEIQRLSK